MAKGVKKVHKLTVKNAKPGTISTGMNTQVLLDGKPLKGVTDLVIKMNAKSITQVSFRMIAEVEIEQDIADAMVELVTAELVTPKKDDSENKS